MGVVRSKPYAKQKIRVDLRRTVIVPTSIEAMKIPQSMIKPAMVRPPGETGTMSPKPTEQAVTIVNHTQD